MRSLYVFIIENKESKKQTNKRQTLRFRIIGGVGIVGGVETLVYINNRGAGIVGGVGN